MTTNTVDKQVASKAIAEMYAEAKALLRCCEAMANENAIYFSYEAFYEEVSGNDHVDWNSSFC